MSNKLVKKYKKFKDLYLSKKNENYYKTLFEKNSIASGYPSYTKKQIKEKMESIGLNALISEILDKVNKNGYPFSYYYLTDKMIWKMFKNLQKYKYKIVQVPYKVNNISFLDKFLFKGKSLILKKDQLDYYRYNILSNYFQEKCRLQCKRYDVDDSPWNYYILESERVKAIKLCLKEYGKFNSYLLREILYQIHRECSSFRPTVYVSLIKKFKAKKILDFSAGWGDRLLGALASNIDFYCGVDPNTCLHKNYKKMIKFFGADSKKYMTIVSEFQTAKLPDIEFDLVATSPPYFKLEKYSDDETQSVSDDMELGNWLHDFLFISMKKSTKYLKINGYLVIIINDMPDQESFVEKMLKYSINLPLDYLGVISYSEYNEKKNRFRSPQPMWIWQKIKK